MRHDGRYRLIDNAVPDHVWEVILHDIGLNRSVRISLIITLFWPRGTHTA